MQPRIPSPVVTSPRAMKGLLMLADTARQAGVPEGILLLIDLRASQINGCSVCCDMHARELKLAGEPDERIFTVSAWREAPYFTDAERAVLALTESATRMADRSDPVPDEVWDEAARHFDEQQLGGIVLKIAGINAWNRINATTRQISGDWVDQLIGAGGQDAADAA